MRHESEAMLTRGIAFFSDPHSHHHKIETSPSLLGDTFCDRFTSIVEEKERAT